MYGKTFYQILRLYSITQPSTMQYQILKKIIFQKISPLPLSILRGQKNRTRFASAISLLCDGFVLFNADLLDVVFRQRIQTKRLADNARRKLV